MADQIIATLSQAEVSALVGQIKATISTFKQEVKRLLNTIYNGNGWVALGYSNFQSFIEAELDGYMTYQTAYRIVQAETIRGELLEGGDDLADVASASDEAVLTLAREARQLARGAGNGGDNVTQEQTTAVIAHKAKILAGAGNSPTADNIRQASAAVYIEQLLSTMFASNSPYQSLRIDLSETFGPKAIEAWINAHLAMPEANRDWVLKLQYEYRQPLNALICLALSDVYSKKETNQTARDLLEEIDLTGNVDGIPIWEATPNTIKNHFAQATLAKLSANQVTVYIPLDNVHKAAKILVNSIEDKVYAVHLAHQILAILKLRMADEETPA